jgi:hypothetical protein
MTEPIEYRTAIGDLARFVTGVRHARARLLLAAAIATDHATVPVTLGGPRFRIGLDVTAIELQSKCPGISLGEFDRRTDDDKVCMVFDLEPGTLPDLPLVKAELIGKRPTTQAEFVEMIGCDKIAAIRTGRQPTMVLFNNAVAREQREWLTPGLTDDGATVPVAELCGLKVMVSTRVVRNPGFLVL